MKRRMFQLLTVILCIGGTLLLKPMDLRADQEVEATAELLQDGALPKPVNIHTASIGQYLSDGTGETPIYHAGKTAEQTIHDGIWNAQERIDVSAYNIPASSVATLVEKVLNDSPDLFFVENRYSYVTSGSDVVSSLIFTYKVSGAALAQQKSFYTAKLNELVGLVNSGWTDEQKVLFVNDYLAQNYEYDQSLVIHDAYNFFYQKKGVCQSYTLVFEAVMQKLGIDVSWATSESMNHIWNVVKLGSNWYHVDVTWDDPTKDLLGRACHTNLLLSDTGITGTGHHDWSCAYTCPDTKYDSYFWKNSTTPFQYINGKWYYAMYESGTTNLYEYSFSTASRTKIADLGKWHVYNDNSRYYQAAYTGLGTYGNELYYNTYNGLYKYNPSSRQSTLVNTPSVLGYIFGMRIEDNSIKYYYAGSDVTSGSIASYRLSNAVSESTGTGSGRLPNTMAGEPDTVLFILLIGAGSLTAALYVYRKKAFA